MKKNLILMTLMFGLMLVSCNKNYTHSKEVTNNTDNAIQVVSGCCDRTETHIIEPRTSKIVFQCDYQFSRPTTEELSWDFVVVEEDGTVTDLSDPSKWNLNETGRQLKYKHTFH